MCQAPCWVLGFKPRRKVTTSLNMGACPDCQDRFLKKPSQNNDSCYQLWMFTGKTDADTEAPTLWLHEAKSRLIGKDPDAGEDWVEEEKGATEDEMVGWHHCLNGHESEQTQGDSEGQRSLECCDSWSCKESDTDSATEQHVRLWAQRVLDKANTQSHHRERVKSQSRRNCFSQDSNTWTEPKNHIT